MEDSRARAQLTGPDIGVNTKSDVTITFALMKQYVLKLSSPLTDTYVIPPLTI